MAIVNTLFKHRKSQKWTWYIYGLTPYAHIIDLFLTSRRSLLNEVKVVVSLSMNSDYRMVIVKLKINRPVNGARRSTNRFTLEKLKAEKN